MGRETDIEWCDSSLNIMAGCDGCELWNRKTGNQHCYAGTLTDRYGGRPGWPKSFEEPTLFLDRLNEGMLWGDVRGSSRPDKPWLNGLPRMIFLNDMGDTFTESLPLDWLARPWGPTVCPNGHKRPRVQWLAERGVWCCSAKGCNITWQPRSPLEVMAGTPHVWMLLTKRGRRMREFSERHPLPANVWPGVSITSEKTADRGDELLKVQGGGVKWLSVEPLLGPLLLRPKWLATQQPCPDGLRGCEVLHLGPPPPVGLVIAGGESGPGARPCNVDWIRPIIRQCKGAGVACFVKQLGPRPGTGPLDAEEGAFPRCWKCGHFDFGPCGDGSLLCNGCNARWQDRLRDAKGGDPTEWPADMRVREFPNQESRS